MPHVERHGTLTSAIARAVLQGNHAEADRIRTELRTQKLEAKIREVVEAAPPLRPEQIERLRALLAPSKTSEAA